MRLVLGQSGFGALRSWERDVALDIAAEALFNKLQSDREQPAIPPWAPPPSSPALTPPHTKSHMCPYPMVADVCTLNQSACRKWLTLEMHPAGSSRYTYAKARYCGKYERGWEWNCAEFWVSSIDAFSYIHEY